MSEITEIAPEVKPAEVTPIKGKPEKVELTAEEKLARMVEYHKNYYKANREKILNGVKAKYSEHKAEINEKNKERYQKNRIAYKQKALERYYRLKELNKNNI